jgi:hypothetical protein
MRNLLKRWLGTSKSEAKGVPQKAALLDRDARVQVLSAHQLSFRKKDPVDQDQSIIPVINVSMSGIALLRGQVFGEAKRSEKIDGDLFVSQSVFSVQLDIIHVTNQVLGCRFIAPSFELKQAIVRYFDLELAALSLSEVNPAVLQRAEDGSPHWLLGKNNCELYFVENDGRLVRFYGAFCGNYFEGERSGTTRFGQVAFDQPRNDLGYPRSTLLNVEQNVAPEMVEACIRFIECIQTLSKVQRDSMCLVLRGAITK